MRSETSSDGYDDVGTASYEEAYVFYGSPTGLGEAVLVPPAPDEGPYKRVGAAGDVNADGYDDVLVGMPYWDGQLRNEGRSSVSVAQGLAPEPLSLRRPPGRSAFRRHRRAGRRHRPRRVRRRDGRGARLEGRRRAPEGGGPSSSAADRRGCSDWPGTPTRPTSHARSAPSVLPRETGRGTATTTSSSETCRPTGSASTWDRRRLRSPLSSE